MKYVKEYREMLNDAVDAEFDTEGTEYELGHVIPGKTMRVLLSSSWPEHPDTIVFNTEKHGIPAKKYLLSFVDRGYNQRRKLVKRPLVSEIGGTLVGNTDIGKRLLKDIKKNFGNLDGIYAYDLRAQLDPFDETPSVFIIVQDLRHNKDAGFFYGGSKRVPQPDKFVDDRESATQFENEDDAYEVMDKLISMRGKTAAKLAVIEDPQQAEEFRDPRFN